MAARGESQQPDRIRRIGMVVNFNDPDIKAFRQELEKHGWADGNNTHIDYRVTPATFMCRRSPRADRYAARGDFRGVETGDCRVADGDPHNTDRVHLCHRSDRRRLHRKLGTPRRQSHRHHGLRAEPRRQMVAPCSRRSHHRLNAWRFWEIQKPPSITITYCTGPRSPRRRSESSRSPASIENDAADIERAIAAVASMPNGAMVVLPDSTTNVNQRSHHHARGSQSLTGGLQLKFFVRAGGLMSYGIVAADHFRQAALYVDRILRGAKPSDLPVQTPTKYETALNRKTAQALGLSPPDGLIIEADEVIE